MVLFGYVVPVGASEPEVRWLAVLNNRGGLGVEQVEASNAQEALSRLDHLDGDVVTLAPDVRVFTTSDPLRKDQWGLDAVPFEAARVGADPSGVVVAVVDTGVDASHEDLNGIVLPGIDLVDGVGDGREDPSGHGTHVAGIVAGIAGNGKGIAGAASGVKILPVRVLDETGSGWASDVVEGIRWAADAGADVINLSLGSTGSGSAYREVMNYAVNVKGAVVVAAAGNGYLEGNLTHYPAADPDAIAVAATTSAGARAPFSNTGSWVDIAAPGQGIVAPCSSLKCGTTSSYVYKSGTSMATPFTSAAAALLVAANPGVGPVQVRDWLTGTAADLGIPGLDVEFGAGLVDPRAALAAADGAPAAPGGVSADQVDVGRVRLSWSAPPVFDLAGFKIERDGKLRATLGSGARTFVDTGLVAGSSYTYVVQSFDLLGLVSVPLSVPVTVSANPPQPPPAGGYWVVGADGRVANTGTAPVLADLGGASGSVVAAAATPSGRGYWLARPDGRLAAFGDAPYLGSLAGTLLNQSIVGLAATPTGEGYWMLGADGGVFTFGDAGYFGSTGDIPLNKPVVDMAPTPTGQGYWLVASDGGVFTFGDAQYHGSTGDIALNQPVTSITAGAGGYWLVATDGGIFAFDVPFWGSLPGLPGGTPGVTGKRIRGTAGGAGYYILGGDGSVFAFGAAPFHGRAPFAAVDLLLTP
jgi:hypothetical protein